MIVGIQTRPAIAPVPPPEYSLPPDVFLLTVRDGSARLLDMGGGFHAVPAIGARMLQETLTIGAVAAAKQIAADYGVSQRQVHDDLAVFLRDLERQGLICSEHTRRRGGALLPARLLLRPAVGAVRRLLKSPDKQARALLGLARVSFALFGWTATVTAWQEAHARFPSRQAGAHDAEMIQALDVTVRAAVARHPVVVACKERALCSWSLARTAGLNASLIVGIELYPMAGHCWCEVAALPLGDDQDRCDQFTPVAQW